MRLIDILANDERVIVLSDRGERLIFTWNQSLTLQCWRERELPATWDEIDAQTLSEMPGSFQEAKASAIRWFRSWG